MLSWPIRGQLPVPLTEDSRSSYAIRVSPQESLAAVTSATLDKIGFDHRNGVGVLEFTGNLLVEGVLKISATSGTQIVDINAALQR